MKFWILWKFSQAIFYQTIKETKQAYILSYVSYFLNNFLLSLGQYPSYMYAILDKILLLKCDCWKWKIKVEIKVNGQYIKGTTIFVFEFLFFTIFITYITFFYEQSIFDPSPKYCLSFSKKLPQKLFSNCYVDGLFTSNILNVSIIYFRDR